jgi:hypothetical protein
MINCRVTVALPMRKNRQKSGRIIPIGIIILKKTDPEPIRACQPKL